MKKRLSKKPQPISSSVLYEALQLEAIHGKLTSSLEFFERKVRRWFSEKFSTPLLEAYKIPWDFVLLHYYEDTIDSMEPNEVFDKAMFEYLPEFKSQAEEDDLEFAQSLIKEQKETIRKKALKDEEYKKKVEQAGEIIEGIKENSNKLSKVTQSLGKPKPESTNLEFDDEDKEE